MLEINHDKFTIDFIDDTNNHRAYFKDHFKNNYGSNFFDISPRRKTPIKNILDINKLFRENNYDILHFHANTLSYITPIMIAIKFGVKVVVHSRSSNSSKKGILRLLHLINKKRIQNKDITRVAVSKNSAEWLFGINKMVHVIYNGLDKKKFNSKQSQNKIIRNKHHLSDKFVIGHIGTFLPVKNHLYIVKIFQRYLEIDDDAYLVLIGEGPTKKYVEKVIKERELANRVLLLDLVDNINDYMELFNIFLFPSIYEGYPNVLLEAQEMRVPCLISDRITTEIDLTNLMYRKSISEDYNAWALQIEKIKLKKFPESLFPSKILSVEESIGKISVIFENLVDSNEF